MREATISITRHALSVVVLLSSHSPSLSADERHSPIPAGTRLRIELRTGSEPLVGDLLTQWQQDDQTLTIAGAKWADVPLPVAPLGGLQFGVKFSVGHALGAAVSISF